MDYFISINTIESGPYSEGQLVSMIKNGHITLGHYARKGDAKDWVKITEIPELKIFFDKPAQPVSPVIQIQKEERKLRHGFTSFVLGLFMIGSVLGSLVAVGDIILMIVFGGSPLAEWFPLSSTFDLWVIRIALVLTMVSIAQLFDWERGGFWLYTFVMAVSAILNPTKGAFWGNFIGSVVSVGILYGILQIHNAYNAKSTWEQLQ